MNKVRVLTICLLLLSSLFTYGQPKRTAFWAFGQNGAALDFNCSPPQPIRSGMSYSIEGTATISDTQGNLLFYTNGDTVYDRTHKVMPNGFGIGATPGCWGSSTQQALIIPFPDSDSLYYIFTTDCAEYSLANGLRYSMIDMSLNGGLGDVVTKFNLLEYPVTEKLAAVFHANSKDVWVLAHEHGTNAFFAYLVTSTGLDTVPVISNVGQVHWLPFRPESMARGCMKFSPNGKRLIVLSVSDQHSYALYPEMFNFNDTSGQVTLNYTIVDPNLINYYGASFSNNNDVLYLSGAWRGRNLHQFDATATSSSSFLASKTVLDDSTRLSALQLGLDGKIYIAVHNGLWIDVIDNPNTLGIGCNYRQKAIYLHD